MGEETVGFLSGVASPPRRVNWRKVQGKSEGKERARKPCKRGEKGEGGGGRTFGVDIGEESGHFE